MIIAKALLLKRGDTVKCPPDRNSPGSLGVVEKIETKVCTDLLGREYIWVTVKHFGHNSIWPSNRLS